MKCLDAGHRYVLNPLDGPGGKQQLVFVKREGLGYPFNKGSHAGTNCQEVIRALIDRVKYLEVQISAPENQIILAGLRSALWAFEIRAARRHGRDLAMQSELVEQLPTCAECGHIGCDATYHSRS